MTPHNIFPRPCRISFRLARFSSFFFAFSFERERLLKLIPRCSTLGRCFFLLCITGFEMTSFSVLRISLCGVIDEVTSASSNRWSGVTTAISTSKHVCLLAVNYSRGVEGARMGRGGPRGSGPSARGRRDPCSRGDTLASPGLACHCRLARPPGTRLGALVARWVFFLSLSRGK